MSELNWKANEFTPRRTTDAVTIPVGLPDDPFAQVDSLSATPEEEEELKRVEKWVEVMAELDTEESAHLLAWGARPKRGAMQ
mmetsp:Transcript_8784/g.23827  ORF Transcript_8784/g.23827 Transcript_8784/m.23827 type:complete len:82 (-) Transcript_8784:51-296(-)